MKLFTFYLKTKHATVSCYAYTIEEAKAWIMQQYSLTLHDIEWTNVRLTYC